MKQDPIHLPPPEPLQKNPWWKTPLLVLTVAVIASGITYFLVTRYLFPRQFQPVQLSDRETAALEAKLHRLDPGQWQPAASRERYAGGAASTERYTLPPKETEPLKPERYDESDAKREIAFSTREINALLAKNTDLAQKLAIDLSENMASARLLIPLDPDFPLFGGKTLKVTAGLELRYTNQKPVVALKGVSVWGVPIPNAWLGGIKNVDLIQEFGMERGFWNTFAAGVEHIQISDGRLTLKLKE